ncbi:hypothetical protein Sjap_009746 [Stephania japonica]|uniref:Uncharacterized protein n=1 Tax=Stephania japonica TaxID=461633 RepID=A0AAP0J8B7_9MAGN
MTDMVRSPAVPHVIASMKVPPRRVVSGEKLQEMPFQTSMKTTISYKSVTSFLKSMTNYVHSTIYVGAMMKRWLHGVSGVALVSLSVPKEDGTFQF